MIQRQHLHYVIDIDIKGFFDNVNHSKLIRQMWALGIRDKKLICIIKEMLKAPIIMPNGEKLYPTKGTDRYNNLVILHKDVHTLIHATLPETISIYLNKIKPTKTMLTKINKLRIKAGNTAI